MSNLNKIMNGYNPHKEQLAQTKKLVEKWNPTGLLEGMDKDFEKHGMAVLLENQARQLIDEANVTNAGGTDGEQWSGVALPLVRRIFGEIASKDFVSVQPMNLPSGLVFFLNFKYGDDSTSLGITGGDEIHGTTKDVVDPTGGLYGAGRFGYTVPVTSILNDATKFSALSEVGVATPKDVNFENTSSTLYEWSATLPKAANFDSNSVRAWSVASGSGLLDSTIEHKYSTISVASNGIGTFKFYSTYSAAADLATVDVTENTLYYHTQPTDSTRGDFEDTQAASAVTNSDTGNVQDIGIPEIDVEMVSEPIVAKTRKLKAVWTPELAQDLNAYHSVDAEAELTSMLSEYISMEIDLEILDMLLANANTTEYWSAKVGEDYDGSGGVGGEGGWSSTTNSAYAYTQNEWFATLGTKLQKVSNKIHQKTMRGGANFLVCGPDVATIIESIPGYNTDTDGTNNQFAMGVEQVGSLRNRWNVYKNPYMTDNQILIGFRGSNFLETGAVYAPYIPLIMTPLVYDPVNFTPRKGVMTRYAKKIVRPEFYGKIIVNGLETV